MFEEKTEATIPKNQGGLYGDGVGDAEATRSVTGMIVLEANPTVAATDD
jgi:hypothetical protein